MEECLQRQTIWAGAPWIDMVLWICPLSSLVISNCFDSTVWSLWALQALPWTCLAYIASSAFWGALCSLLLCSLDAAHFLCGWSIAWLPFKQPLILLCFQERKWKFSASIACLALDRCIPQLLFRNAFVLCESELQTCMPCLLQPLVQSKCH